MDDKVEGERSFQPNEVPGRVVDHFSEKILSNCNSRIIHKEKKLQVDNHPRLKKFREKLLVNNSKTPYGGE